MFKPRIDGPLADELLLNGPLIMGESFEAGAEVRDGAGFAGCAGAEGTSVGSVDRVAPPAAGADAAGAGAGNSVVPHMPQKRFVSEFSLPQRAQRTDPPKALVF